MRSFKTDEEWMQLFELRKNFTGNTTEFCRQHKLVKTTYYAKARLLNSKKENGQAADSQFIKVIQPTKSTFPTKNVSFNLRSSELTLPIELGTANIVDIIKGIMS